MMEFIILPLSLRLNEKDKETITRLNERFKKIGVSLVLKEKESNGIIYPYCTIYCDTEVFDKKTSRNAGKPPCFLKSSMPVEEVRKRMKEESAQRVAESLNISRSTLYRKLKFAEEIGVDYIR